MKKTVFFLLVLSVLLLFVSCGNTTTEVTTEEAVTTADTPVTTTAPTTTTTTTPVTTTTPITTEAPDDAWKEKVEWGYDFPTDVVIDEESGKYKIGIKVYDRQGVGEKNAYAAFAEHYNLEFYADEYIWEYIGIITWASMEEIEFYAKLDEVKLIRFDRVGHTDDPVIEEIGWWQHVKTVRGIARVKNADGSVSYRFGLTIHSGSNLFPLLSDGSSTLERIDLTNARVFIKRLQYDNDYTEYKVSAWQVSNLYDLSFEVEGFVPEANVAYDMYLFFTLPEGTPYPGEWCYIWALEEPWTLVPLPTTPPDHFLAGDMEVSWWQALKWIDGITAFENADGSTRYTFGLTVDKEANDFFPDDSFAEISAEGAYVYIQKLNYETKHTKYQVKSLTATAEGRLEFEVLGFVPEQDARYDVFLFYIMPEGSLYPGEKGYVWTVGDAWVLQ